MTLEQEWNRLGTEVIERKTEIEIPRIFADLRNQSNARVLLKDPNKAEDLASSVERDLTQPEPPPHPGQATGPKGTNAGSR